jgi:hypothetical protein
MQLIVIEYTPWPDFRSKNSMEIAAPKTPEDRAFRKVIKNNEIRKGNTPIMNRKSPMISVGKFDIEHVEKDLLHDYNVKK